MGAMDLEELLRLNNRNMIGFDLALGSAAILAPSETLQVLGHRHPTADAEALFRRCGPIWLTFAAAHAVAHLRGTEKDWAALAWLRGTEIATDALWSGSPGFERESARWAMRAAGVSNLAMALGYGFLSRRVRRSEAAALASAS